MGAPSSLGFKSEGLRPLIQPLNTKFSQEFFSKGGESLALGIGCEHECACVCVCMSASTERALTSTSINLVLILFFFVGENYECCIVTAIKKKRPHRLSMVSIGKVKVQYVSCGKRIWGHGKGM